MGRITGHRLREKKSRFSSERSLRNYSQQACKPFYLKRYSDFWKHYLSHEKVDLVCCRSPQSRWITRDSESMTYIKPFLSGFETQIPAYPHSHV